MPVSLSKPVAANSAADPFDARQLKKALNRLGFYQPLATTGITGIPDRALFDALKKFQTRHGLSPTGTVEPDDETLHQLNDEADKTPTGFYIWRSVEDDKVRGAHVVLNGTRRAFWLIVGRQPRSRRGLQLPLLGGAGAGDRGASGGVGGGKGCV